MIVKMLLTLDFDPATGEYKSLKAGNCQRRSKD